MTGYTWHQVSEKEREEIKKDAKKLLDEFSSKLSKVFVKEKKENLSENVRSEGSGWQTSEEFRELVFGNAPLVDDGFIIAEKGAWKK